MNEISNFTNRQYFSNNINNDFYAIEYCAI